MNPVSSSPPSVLPFWAHGMCCRNIQSAAVGERCRDVALSWAGLWILLWDRPPQDFVSPNAHFLLAHTSPWVNRAPLGGSSAHLSWRLSCIHSQGVAGGRGGVARRAGLELQNGGFTPMWGALVFFQGGLSLRMCLTLQGLSPWPFSLAGSLESFPGGWLPGMQSANCQASLRFGLTTSTSLLVHFIGTVSHRTRPDSVWEGGACRCGYRCGYRCIEGRFADWQLQRGRESPAGDSDPLERKQR